jgi:hypothetical protein
MRPEEGTKMSPEVIEKIEILFAIEGRPRHFSADAHPKMTIAEFAKLAAKEGQIEEAVDIFLEDAEAPLEGHLILIEQLPTRFAPLHVARPGKITVTVEYQGQPTEHVFQPSVTIARVIEWAIGPGGVGSNGKPLEGTVADYQMKHDGEVVSPDDHLGQVARGKKAVNLALVFKVKPQG